MREEYRSQYEGRTGEICHMYAAQIEDRMTQHNEIHGYVEGQEERKYGFEHGSESSLYVVQHLTEVKGVRRCSRGDVERYLQGMLEEGMEDMRVECGKTCIGGKMLTHIHFRRVFE